MKLHKGFTLIELMIVVAIVAVITAIALPSYQSYVKKTKRVEVQAYLMELSHKAESYKLSNQTLTGLTITKLGNIAFPSSGQNNYTISLNLLNNSRGVAAQYVLAATPTSTGVQKGTGIVTLTSTGTQCWYRNNDSASILDTLDNEGNIVPATPCNAKWTDK